MQSRNELVIPACPESRNSIASEEKALLAASKNLVFAIQCNVVCKKKNSHAEAQPKHLAKRFSNLRFSVTVHISDTYYPFVIPAYAGIHQPSSKFPNMDSALAGNDMFFIGSLNCYVQTTLLLFVKLLCKNTYMHKIHKQSKLLFKSMTSTKSNNKYRKLFFYLMFFMSCLIVSSLYFAINYFQLFTKEVDNTQEYGIVQKDNTIRFLPIAWSTFENSLYIKYNGLVFQENTPGGQGVTLKEWEISHQKAVWQNITKLQFVSDMNHASTIFDFKLFPDKSGFVLITSHTSNHQINPTSGISYYNIYFIVPDNHTYSGDYPSMQFASIGSKFSSKGYWIPVIESISSDSKAIAFKLFGCWACGGHIPEMLVSVIPADQNGHRDFKNIGYVAQYPSSFEWKQNGVYSYIPYPEQCAKLDPEEFAKNPNAEKDCINKYPSNRTQGKLNISIN